MLTDKVTSRNPDIVEALALPIERRIWPIAEAGGHHSPGVE
jgi:hypothetical protein